MDLVKAHEEVDKIDKTISNLSFLIFLEKHKYKREMEMGLEGRAEETKKKIEEYEAQMKKLKDTRSQMGSQLSGTTIGRKNMDVAMEEKIKPRDDDSR